MVYLVLVTAWCYPLIGCSQPPPSAPSTPPNVLLLVVDTLRADALSCYGGKEIQTPNLDRLASEAHLFKNAISPSPWTVPSMASILTGLSPLTHNAKMKTTYPEDTQSLQVRLKKNGYL